MPILAIVGDPTESLWLPNGVMANPYGRTMLWERPISLEVINGPAGDDYQIDCGIRVHGNFRDYTIGNDWYSCYPDDTGGPSLTQISSPSASISAPITAIIVSIIRFSLCT